MKRNIIRIVLLSCLLLGVFAFSTAAFADNGQQQLPKAGILPDSPFYFLNKIGQDIGMFFTFGNQAKAEKALQYAGQSLAAAQAMAAKGKDNLVAEAAKEYQQYMQQVQDRLQSSSDNGSSGNLSERIALATGLHLTVLDGLSGNLTGQAAQAIAHALTVSVNGQELALKELARHHAEQALKIAGDNINAHLQALHDRTDNVTGSSGNLTGELDIADQLSRLEDQLSAAAAQQGANVTSLQQWLTQATGQRLQTLSEVYDKVPEQARTAIQHAAENSLNLFQRAIDRLSSDNTTGDDTRGFSDNSTGPFHDFSGNFTGISGNFSAARSLLNRLGNTVREHLELDGTDNVTGFSGNFTFRHGEGESAFSGNSTGFSGNFTFRHTEGDHGSSGNATGPHAPMRPVPTEHPDRGSGSDD